MITQDSTLDWFGEYKTIPGYFWLDLEEEDYALCLPLEYSNYLSGVPKEDHCYVVIPKKLSLIDIQHDLVSNLKRVSKTLEKYRYKAALIDIESASKENYVFFSPLKIQHGVRWRRADK